MVAFATLIVAAATQGGALVTQGPVAARLASTPSNTASAAAPCAPSGTLPTPPSTFTHVIWIFEENQTASTVLGSAQAPYFNGLAAQCGLATNWHNVSHDSLTNYVGALSGQLTGSVLLTQGKDCSPARCPQPQASLFGQVLASGHTWKGYAESMPGPCSSVNTTLYMPKHAPAPYFSDVASSCAARDVSLSYARQGGPTVTAGNLRSDLTHNTLPTFALITPNLCDDGHTACNGANRVSESDLWLAAWLPAILNSAAYRGGGTAVFVTWDEGLGRDFSPAETCWDATHASASAYPSCSVATLAVSPYTPPTVSTNWFNHFNLLAATEAMLGLPALPTSSTTGGTAAPNDARVPFNLR
jgi:hypothetical protein